MSKEVYEFDLQNKMEGGLWPVGDGIQVKCWKSLPTRVRDEDRFVTPFNLIIGTRPAVHILHERRSYGCHIRRGH
jgi:hypothetical protein